MNTFLRVAALALAITGCAAPTEAQTQPMANELSRFQPVPYVRLRHPEWSKDAVLYQVNLRQFTPEGTLAAAQQQLPRLKALGVSTLTRQSTMPDVPPLAESAGMPGFESSAGIGFLAPAGTSKDIIARLHTSTVKVINTPETRKLLQSQGVELVGNSPQEFTSVIQEETAKWGKVVRAGNIKLD